MSTSSSFPVVSKAAGFQAFQPPSSSRYVLLYSVSSVPTGLALVPDSMTGCLGPAQSWTEYENACDPYLSHIVYMECPCKKRSREISLMACNLVVTRKDPTEKIHKVVSCSRECADSRTKVRILRRGSGPIRSGQPSAMLEVEVIGKMSICEKVKTGNTMFELFAVDSEGQRFKAVRRQENDDGSWDLEVEGNRGLIKGFEGHWEKVEWDDESYDFYGLCGIDRHCAPLEGWPPVEWFYDDNEQKDDESQVQGVEASKEENLFQGVEAGEEVNFVQGVVQVVQEGNLVQVINAGGHEEDEDSDDEGYDASDAESAS